MQGQKFLAVVLNKNAFDVQVERDLGFWIKEKLIRRTLGNVENRVKLDGHVYGNVFTSQWLVRIAR